MLTGIRPGIELYISLFIKNELCCLVVFDLSGRVLFCYFFLCFVCFLKIFLLPLMANKVMCVSLRQCVTARSWSPSLHASRIGVYECRPGAPGVTRLISRRQRSTLFVDAVVVCTRLKRRSHGRQSSSSTSLGLSQFLRHPQLTPTHRRHVATATFFSFTHQSSFSCLAEFEL